MTVNKTITHHFGKDTGFRELDSGSIDFKEHRNLFGQLKPINVTLDYLRVSFTSVSNYLEIDKSTILKLKFLGDGEHEGINIKNLQLSSYHNPYQVLINQDAIKDCVNLKVETAELRFSVKIRLAGEVIQKDYVITIKLSKDKPNCKINFKALPDLKYKHEKMLVGHLEIANSCPFIYSETAAIEVNLKYNDQENVDIVSFGEENEIKESNPYFASSGLMDENDILKSILIKKSLSPQNIVLKKLNSPNIVTIPVYMDLNRQENPDGNFRVENFTVLSKNILNDVPGNPLQCKVTIFRDFTSTSLSVNCNGHEVENNETMNAGHFYWIEHEDGKENRFDGTLNIIKITVGNKATNRGSSPNSAVVVRNAKIIPIYNNNEINADEQFLKTKELDNNIHKFKNGIDSCQTYTCILLHKHIYALPMRKTKLLFKISFEYIEDEQGVFKGEDMPWNKYTSKIEMVLEKDPGREWLCVDYGTSATVSVFGDGTPLNMKLLPLNRRNREIIQERETNNYRNPLFESGDIFLSSNIMLQNNTPSINSNNYNNSLVYLSPSEPRFHANSYRLPYMKALVGYKNMPNQTFYNSFTYKSDCNSNIILTFKDKPLDVETIFKSTYHVLFRDYISNCINGKEVNKIVLTIPNTYTPQHIEFLRRIVKKEIPSVIPEYIWFASESDSIAYYYLKNWLRINPNERKDSFNEKTEHVLVYDMGAGTLDMTYLTIENVESGEKNVDIVAKIGLNKAGNYLDYVLAESLVTNYPEAFPREILHHTDDTLMQNLQCKLKFFIKMVLKPKLFKDDTDKIIFNNWNGQTINNFDFNDFEIDLKKVRKNELIQKFITECTDELLNRFIQLNELDTHKIKIDTVMMTGRSVQFGSIKSRLLSAIKNWNDNTECFSVEITGDQLKTIVSEGALYYAALYGKRNSSVKLTNHNIFARYGVLYTDIQNKWRYQPLIDKHTRSTSHNTAATGQRNGLQIFTYDTDIYSAENNNQYIEIDMRNTIVAYLVQCYSTNPGMDFENDEHRNDYISIMASFSPNSVTEDISRVHLRLEIDRNNEMIFTAGSQTFPASAVVKIDIESNETYKHSMWPYA